MKKTLALMANAQSQLAACKAVVGLDGFIDKIIRVVGHKSSDGAVEYIPTMAALAQRIANAAGKSTALELHVQKTKLGGNGPIMANAMASFGVKVTYIGAIGGTDGVAPVFRPMAERCRLTAVCPAASTDALEFDDGKLMLQQMACLDDLDYAAVTAAIPEPELLDLLADAELLALNHWSSLPHMSAIWRSLQQRICPQLPERRRHLFFDLADPEKRSDEDICEALELIGSFGKWYRTVLGLNAKEAEQLCRVLGCDPTSGDDRERTAERASRLQAAVKANCVAVHPVQYAAAANASGVAVVDGPHTQKPLISTGAGDHFNAGFCMGRILGGDLEDCLRFGVHSSGHYVFTARTADVASLRDFMANWQG